jgi:hypothetical protein
MHKLIFLLALSLAACSSDSKNNPPAQDAPVAMDATMAAKTCYQGTATTHAQLINACVDSSVTMIVKYSDLAAERAALPLLNPDGTLPPPL